MFWFKKKKEKKIAPVSPQKPTREDILAQARASAAAARAEIGDENLDKIRQAMLKKENNPLEQAKKKVMEMDRQKVADSVSDWMREKE